MANKSRLWVRSLLILTIFVSLVASHALAGEAALSQKFDDSKLQWGPCPAFMPQGCGIAVLHGDPAKANADVFFKVPAGAKVPAHWHTSAERMILASGEFHVAYEGQPTVILTPGMYAYGPAKAVHTASCESKTACVLFIAFESPVDAVAAEKPTK